MKKRRKSDALGCGRLKVCAKALTFSPSIISYAGKQGGKTQFVILRQACCLWKNPSWNPLRWFGFLFASPAAASYLFLGKKVTKTQGLDLMSDKFVKAFIAASQAAMKNRRIRDALGCGRLKVCAKALTFSPSIISYAG